MSRPIVVEIELCDACGEAIEPALFDEPDDRVAMEAIARKLEKCQLGCASYAALVRNNAAWWMTPADARKRRRRG